jgi:hypothetical protein
MDIVLNAMFVFLYYIFGAMAFLSAVYFFRYGTFNFWNHQPDGHEPPKSEIDYWKNGDYKMPKLFKWWE